MSMKSEEQSVPKCDLSGYNFLYPFYYLGYRKNIPGSPADDTERNLQQANRLAARLVEKMAYFSKAYEERGFPVINLDDPCGLLSSLAIKFWVRDETPSWMDDPSPHIIAGLAAAATSKHGEDVPNHMRWLGRLEVYQYRQSIGTRDSEPHISLVELNQPGSDKPVRMGAQPGYVPLTDRGYFSDSYPANAQAMNFISMVDDYLDKLDQNRLVVVRG